MNKVKNVKKNAVLIHLYSPSSESTYAGGKEGGERGRAVRIRRRRGRGAVTTRGRRKTTDRDREGGDDAGLLVGNAWASRGMTRMLSIHLDGLGMMIVMATFNV